MKRIIYHGSEKIIESPAYHYEGSNIHNDYGLGFYCSFDVELSKEWANRRTNNGYTNKYQIDDISLKILDLTDKSKYSVLNWIAILLHNRELSYEIKEAYKEELEFLNNFYIDTSLYDVVIGFRADDAYFRFPLMFIEGVLRLEKLDEIYLNGNLGMQYVVISPKAFSLLKWKGATPTSNIHHERYLSRIGNANDSYRELELNERRSKGTRIRDLMENYDK